MRKVGYSNIENVFISDMETGIYVSWAFNNFRNISVNTCATGIRLGDQADLANEWSTTNLFIGGNVTGCTLYGIRFNYAWGNTLDNVCIENNNASSVITGISLECYDETNCGGNTIQACFIENNHGSQIRVASAHNRITSNHFCNNGSGSSLIYIDWVSGADALDGNTVIGNWFNCGTMSQEDYFLSRVGIGTVTPTEMLDVNGNLKLGSEPSIKWTGNFLNFEGPAGENLIKVLNLRGSSSFAPRIDIQNAGNTQCVSRIEGGAGGTSFINNGGNFGIGTSTPKTKLQLSGTNAAITFSEQSATPASAPSSGNEAQFYMKGDKLVVRYMDGTTVRYKYLPLNGTSVTWVHTTTAP